MSKIAFRIDFVWIEGAQESHFNSESGSDFGVIFSDYSFLIIKEC